MKIAKIILKGFQQFENFYLDLEHPETGKPAEKICFIGPNGTGKTTLLQFIPEVLSLLPSNGRSGSKSVGHNPFFAVKIHAASGDFFAVCQNFFLEQFVYYQAEVEETEEWQRFVTDPNQRRTPQDFCLKYHLHDRNIPKLNGAGELIIHVPADQPLKLSKDPPRTNVSNSLVLFQKIPVFHSVSISTAVEFWNLLIYQIKKRESNYQEYLKKPENKKKTVEQVEAEFEENHPEILPEIGKIWNRILEKAGLEFDLEKVQIPVQLTDNLRAYIKLKKSNQQLAYNQLSSGIRNYIFKLGHIRSLYFQRHIERGFLLVDEPENSLYPDMLYGLISEYLSIIENTQLFVATHSPIIAAQFQPHERIHLEFDEQGTVTASHGVTPIGDDPNDLLIKDFHVRSVYGKEGLRQWERFLYLQRLISETNDLSLREQLLDEYLEIGGAYNFEPTLELDEIS